MIRKKRMHNERLILKRMQQNGEEERLNQKNKL